VLDGNRLLYFCSSLSNIVRLSIPAGFQFRFNGWARVGVVPCLFFDEEAWFLGFPSFSCCSSRYFCLAHFTDWALLFVLLLSTIIHRHLRIFNFGHYSRPLSTVHCPLLVHVDLLRTVHAQMVWGQSRS
jgi:hypothetical protein